jgi:hypothetical protein
MANYKNAIHSKWDKLSHYMYLFMRVKGVEQVALFSMNIDIYMYIYINR